MSRTTIFGAAAAFAAALAATAATAVTDFYPAYIGAWTIAEGHAAPWVDPKDPATAPFDDRILGKTVTFTPERIIAPRPLSCRKADYSLHDVPPEALFQGGLTRPAEQATALGFSGPTSRRLDTNCNAMLEYHFTDAGTMLFALNNTIYTLRRKDRRGEK